MTELPREGHHSEWVNKQPHYRRNGEAVTYSVLQDLHKRSQSLQSERSQTLSTQSTDDTYSSSESRHRPHYARDDSYPTSPEDELTGSLYPSAVASRAEAKTSLYTPVSASRKSQEDDKGADQRSALSTVITPVPAAPRGRRSSSNLPSVSPSPNRGKPLPIPNEVHRSSTRAKSSDATSACRSPLPTLKVSPALLPNQVRKPRKATESATSRSAGGSTSSEDSRPEDLPSTRGRSSISSRSKHTSETAGPYKSTGISSTSQSLGKDPASSSASQQMPRSNQKPSSEALLSSGPRSTSRPSSPFIFRHGNSWLGGSKVDYLQDRHLKAPPATWDMNAAQQPSSSASSSSSHASSGLEAKPAKRTMTSIMPNFSRTLRFVDQGKRASFTPEADNARSSLRPPLHRHRSKSMDVMQRYKGDAVLSDVIDLTVLQDVDSIAVGRTSVIEVEVPKRSAVDSDHSDWSRLSRLLTRRSSTVALKNIEMAAESAPKVPTKIDTGREGALSRLTGSLLGKKPSISAKVANRNPPFHKQESTSVARPKKSLDTTAVLLSKQSHLMPSKDDSKLSAQSKEPPNQPLLLSPSKPQRKSADPKAPHSSPSDSQIKRLSITNQVGSRSSPLKSDSRAHRAVVEKKLDLMTHSRNQSSDLDDDFFSIMSLTPSTSQQAFCHKTLNGIESKDGSPARTTRISMSRRRSPPSSYREWAADANMSMTKSESDPILLNEQALPPHERKPAKSSQPCLPQVPRSTSLSSIDDGKSGRAGPSIKPIARAVTVASRVIVAPSKDRQNAALPAMKDEPLPLPDKLASEFERPEKSSARSRRDFRRASLSVDVRASNMGPIPRPKSAMEMTKDVAQRPTTAPRRRPSQATLSIADDLEFLQALEHVRKVNRDRIKKKDEDANRVDQMARMGMAPVKRRPNDCEGGRGRQDSDTSRSSHSRRSASAHECMDSSQSSRMSSVESDSLEVPSALELGVGKASGKMQDGTFINDDDWKKEVKALFIIREIVLTERSYARHLEALLHSVRALHPPVKKTSGSSSSASRMSVSVPSHITTLRRLLPQLIALSRGLADRIDANPTAAGVGAAFSLISAQLEATYIAWSSVVTQVMNALRVSEKAKSKTKDRIGLITLSPLEQVGVNELGCLEGFKTVPNSPMSAAMPLLAVPGTIRAEAISDNNDTERLPMRRRSTLSGLSPSLTASFRTKAIASLSSDSSRKKTEDSMISAGSSSFGKRAMEALAPSSSAKTPAPKTKARSDSMSLPSKSKPLLPLTPATATSTPNNGASLDALSGKRLSAMDVVIMPTQRLLRYLLLLKDLNTNTPPQSLSHIRIQRCLDSLAIMASSCDKASSATSSSTR